MAKIRANGIDIEYETFGPKDGVPFLLIHGFAQQLIAWAPEFIDGLTAAGLRVITFDNRDVGLAKKWDGEIPDFAAITAAMKKGRKPNVPYALSDMAADAAGLLDALGIESAHICGASMGGQITQLIGMDHPKKARSLVPFITTTSDTDLPEPSPEAQAAIGTYLKPDAQPPADDRAAVIALALSRWRIWASTAWPFDEARMADQIGRGYDRCHYPEGLLRQWSALLSAPPRGKRLQKVRLPALVMHGSADILVPPPHGRRVAASIRGSEYHEIDGWGHDMPLGVIPQLLGYILPFVNKVEARRRSFWRRFVR